MSNESHLRYLLSRSTFREIEDCRPREMGALSTFSAFRDDVAATAPRETYFATRHHEAFRIERRANHSTHGSACAYHTTAVASFFPPLAHIVHDAALYIFLCCIKCLSPRYHSRDALLQYVRAVRCVFITYSLVSFHLYDGPLMFNLLRALTILFMRGGKPPFCRGATPEEMAEGEREDLKPYY